MNDQLEKFHEFEKVTLEIKDFPCDGFVLDIGGGGEGVIGRLKGQKCVAIDIRLEELNEAAEGPLKIVMDARDLKFLDKSFSAATAFFSMMYVESKEDHQKIFKEVYRVLKPGGYFYLWEVNLAERPDTDKSIYVVNLLYRVKDEEFETGYGQHWPDEPRGEQYYLSLAGEAGFHHLQIERNGNTFYMIFQKE
jgi:ubiquinone/menaquinone biosynthesis C-methylase UbiE